MAKKAKPKQDEDEKVIRFLSEPPLRCFSCGCTENVSPIHLRTFTRKFSVHICDRCCERGIKCWICGGKSTEMLEGSLGSVSKFVFVCNQEGCLQLAKAELKTALRRNQVIF